MNNVYSERKNRMSDTESGNDEVNMKSGLVSSSLAELGKVLALPHTRTLIALAAANWTSRSQSQGVEN